MSIFYHFGVKVFHILGVENGHERLGAHGLAAVFLAHHQSDVLGVVLEVVDERLALAPDGLSDIIFQCQTTTTSPPPPQQHNKQPNYKSRSAEVTTRWVRMRHLR